MARKNQTLINFHGKERAGLETAKAQLLLGEIAVVTKDHNLAIKDSTGNLHYFIDSATTVSAIAALKDAVSGAKATKIENGTVDNLVKFNTQGDVADALKDLSYLVEVEEGKRLIKAEEADKLAGLADNATKVSSLGNGKIEVTYLDGGVEKTDVITIVTTPTDLAIDANYKHIAVTAESVSEDGVEVFKRATAASGLTVADGTGLNATNVQGALKELSDNIGASEVHVADGDRVLTLTNGKLSSHLSVVFDADNHTITLKDKDGVKIGESIDTTPFETDVMIESVHWENEGTAQETNRLIIEFNDDEHLIAPIDFGKFVDIYTVADDSTTYMSISDHKVKLLLGQDGLIASAVASAAAEKKVNKSVYVASTALTLDNNISAADLTSALNKATDTAKGVESKEDFDKIEGIEEGAEVNDLDTVNFAKLEATTVTEKTQSGIVLSEVSEENKTLSIDFSNMCLDGGEW